MFHLFCHKFSMFNTNGKSWLDLKCAEDSKNTSHTCEPAMAFSFQLFFVEFNSLLLLSFIYNYQSIQQPNFLCRCCLYFVSKLKYNFNRYEHCTVSVNVVLKFLFDRKRKSSITQLVLRMLDSILKFKELKRNEGNR